MGRKEIGERSRNWEISTRGEVLFPKLEAKHDKMSMMISKAYDSIDSLYEHVAKILDNLGIFGANRVIYRAFAQELYKLSQNISGKAFELEAKAIAYKYVHYRCDTTALKEIAALFGVDISEAVAPAVVITEEDIRFYQLMGAILYGW